MQNWDADRYLSSVSSPNITLEEEKRLFSILENENSSDYQKQDAIEVICRSHIRFVSQTANYYCKRCHVDMEDMISAGVLGMMTAIDKFKLAKNCKFTTYCGWWIKMEMIKHIQTSYTVNIPQSVQDGLIKIQKAIRESESELSRDEIKEQLEFSEKRMKTLEEASVFTLSINESGGDDSFLENFISEDSLTPYEVYEKEDMIQCFREILSELDEKVLEIVMSKYSEKKVRLQDLSDKYGVSLERIRQLRVEYTKQIRNSFLEKMKVTKIN